MFSKQIEEIKNEEQKARTLVAFHEKEMKAEKARLAALTKARVQLEKTQEQFTSVTEEVADEQPDISDERIVESAATA